MLEVLFVLLGCIAGILSGLTPGIHINTISLVVLAFAAQGSEGFSFVLFIVSMAVMHSFVDFIPSIVLGAPEQDNFLSVLPGHRMLLKGKGYLAVKLCLVGGLFGAIISLALSPFVLLFVYSFNELIYSSIAFVLFFVLLLMILGGRNNKERFWALIVMILSGALGVIVLKNFVAVGNGLFALVTGFFGLPTIVYSLKQKNCIAGQRLKESKFSLSKCFKASSLGFLGGIFVSLFPAVSSSEAAFVLRKFYGRVKTTFYLVLLGAISTSSIILAFFVLYSIGKARTGAAAAVKQLIVLRESHLFFIFAAAVFSAGAGFIISDLIARKALENLHKVNYSKLNFVVISFLFLITFYFSGFLGLIVMCTAAGIGLLSISRNTKRSNSMAFLLIPTLLFYLGF
ncbi:MAG: tripartite tricarboxylate transporter permease [Candidatus Diapherotrites archaeon]